MRKKISMGKRTRYWAEYILVRFVFWFFRLLGCQKASNLGAWIGQHIGPRLAVHQTAEKNLKMALPHLSDIERIKILHDMWGNLGRNAAEVPFVGDLLIGAQDVELAGEEYLDEYMASGEAAIFVTGHFGPWEATALAGKYCNIDVSVIYRAANNPMVEAYFQKERAGVGYKFFPKGKHGARAILKTFKAKKPVMLLNDQKQNNGIAIPFFGHEAMTATAIADFACRMKLPVYPLRAERLEGGRIRVTVYKALYAPQDGDPKENVVRFLITINEVYEQWIREKPDHWFWVHNRW